MMMMMMMMLVLGLRCDDDDACVSNPCRSNAICETLPANGSYQCICERGWTGLDCDVDINECALSAYNSFTYLLMCSFESRVSFHRETRAALSNGGVTVHRCLRGKASSNAALQRQKLPVASGSVLPAAINSSCHVIVAASSAVGRSLSLVRRWSGTHCLITSGTQRQRSALTVSSHAWRHTCFRCIIPAAH